MPDPIPVSRQQRRENPEPRESSNPVPITLIALMAGLLGWAGGYLTAAHPDVAPELGDQRTLSALEGNKGTAAAGAVDGAEVYVANCVACHQSNGAGLPQVFPPLAGSEWVQGDEATLVQIILHGIQGPITVSGQSFDSVMPPLGSALDDAQIAAVASHVRGQWGNKAGPISAETVAAQRAKTQARTTPWAGGAELESLEP